MKNMSLPVAVAVAIIGCVLAVSANVTSNEMHNSLGQERYKRMVAEEQAQKFKNHIKKLENELADARKKMADIEGILNQGRSMNTNLQAKLEALNQEKEMLRQRVEGANPSAQPASAAKQAAE